MKSSSAAPLRLPGMTSRFVKARPMFESPVEFLQLLDKSLLQVVLVPTADEFRLAGIRKDGDCSAGRIQ